MSLKNLGLTMEEFMGPKNKVFKLIISLLVVLFLAGFNSWSIAGQEKNDQLLTTETFFEFESLRNPAISPDGKSIVFTRNWIDKVNDLTRSNIWMVETDGSRLRQLTSGNWRDSSPVWSPDGKKLAFISDRGGSDQIYIMFIDTKEVACLTNLERTPQNIVWSPDGERIAFSLFVADDKPILPVKMLKK
ncbi:MAG: DPP IV N-terminal domain-containing protein, partial [Candidatus Saccharicenans sp.]|nr:DPP IV N-terminal domain-containing protein [Candidatus Saccharicenans sp.]